MGAVGVGDVRLVGRFGARPIGLWQQRLHELHSSRLDGAGRHGADVDELLRGIEISTQHGIVLPGSHYGGS